ATGFGQQYVWYLDNQGSLLGGNAIGPTEPPTWDIAGTGDMDGDGKEDDLVWQNSETGQIAVWQTEFTNGQSQVTGGYFINNPLS
ncbi:hypothetical protein, partial [Haemophilus parainfluenzae]|uniref:hypothetical protein n=1 Tax=Haemophilus parainfluenzae TaxID=729 RepID=UPI001CEC6DE1